MGPNCSWGGSAAPAEAADTWRNKDQGFGAPTVGAKGQALMSRGAGLVAAPWRGAAAASGTAGTEANPPQTNNPAGN